MSRQAAPPESVWNLWAFATNKKRHHNRTTNRSAHTHYPPAHLALAPCPHGEGLLRQRHPAGPMRSAGWSARTVLHRPQLPRQGSELRQRYAVIVRGHAKKPRARVLISAAITEKKKAARH